MSVSLLIIVVVIIILLEVPGLIKEKLYKEIVGFSVVLLMGIYMTVAYFYRLPFYNPFESLAVLLSKYYFGG